MYLRTFLTLANICKRMKYLAEAALIVFVQHGAARHVPTLALPCTAYQAPQLEPLASRTIANALDVSSSNLFNSLDPNKPAARL